VASRHLQTALSLARDLGDAWAESWVLHLLARVAYFDGDAATAEQLGQQSLTIARRLGDDWLVGWALHVLALAAHIDGDYARARARYEESIAVRRPIGYREGIGVCLYLLGLVLYSEGNYARAHQRLCESLPIMRDVSYYGVPSVLAAAASIAARLGQPKRAARLAGATASFSVAVDADPIPLAEAMLTQALDLARRAIGDAAYAAAWAEGRAMSLAAAIDEVMADAASADGSPAVPGESAVGAPPRPADAASPREPVPTPLTHREAAVLGLIAAGSTTREIAAALCVSVPTVERHITHLYGKIGARGRADATAYAVRHGLAATPPSEMSP
jgi:non-specific serine/threonine protein kinase